MHSQLCVTFDSHVLAVPSLNCSKREFAEYANMLMNWKDLIDNEFVEVSVSENVIGTLCDENFLPTWDHLRQLFCKHKLDEPLDTKMLWEFIYQILSADPKMETMYKFQYVYSDNVETDPSLPGLNASSKFIEEQRHFLTQIAILRKHCAVSIGELAIVLKKTPAHSMQLTADVLDIDHSRPDIPNPYPLKFSGDILAFDSIVDCINYIDIQKIMMNATDNADIKLAIRLALIKDSIQMGGEIEWDIQNLPMIGSKFRMRCQRVCSDRGGTAPERVLGSIVETVMQRNMRAVHSLRNNKSGGAPNIMRGTDIAQRRDVDSQLHLHYWDCGNNNVELAWLTSEHDDCTIPK